MNEEPRQSGITGRATESLASAQQLSEETAQKLIHFLENSAPVRSLRASQIASAVMGTVGLALFIVGIERAAEDIPVISNPYGSIAIGIFLLLATGLLFTKLRGQD